MLGGAHPKKTKKNQSLHQNWQIGIGFFWFFLVFFGFLKFPNWHWFFLVFFGFFGIGFGQNSKLETGFFWFFLVFLGFFGFFWLKLWPTFEIGNWFLVFLVFLVFFGFFFGFFGFFWHLILWLECHPKKNQKKPKNTKKNQKKTKKNQKNPKKNQKKPVATPKLVNWLGFFWFFLVFFGVSTPPVFANYYSRSLVTRRSCAFTDTFLVNGF